MIERILYTADATTEGRPRRACTNLGRSAGCRLGRSGGDGWNGRAWDEPGAAVRRRLFGLLSLPRVAAGKKLDLTGSRVTASVGIGPEREGGLCLAVTLDLEARY